VGAIRVAVTEADYYTVSGQKWLCGPELTGALYVADPDGLRPRLVADPAAFGIPAMPGAARLEMAFHPAPLVAGLLAAVDAFPTDAFERAARLTARCRELLLAAGVRVLTDPDQGTLVAFTISGLAPEEVVDRCEEHGVVIRSLPNGWLRASCGWWNSEGDLERLVASLPLD
jgi:L-cysteine/cystine lyase